MLCLSACTSPLCQLFELGIEALIDFFVYVKKKIELGDHFLSASITARKLPLVLLVYIYTDILKENNSTTITNF